MERLGFTSAIGVKQCHGGALQRDLNRFIRSELLLTMQKSTGSDWCRHGHGRVQRQKRTAESRNGVLQVYFTYQPVWADKAALIDPRGADD